jgi:drug/metabolite transporter (DMT)-like permease
MEQTKLSREGPQGTAMLVAAALVFSVAALAAKSISGSVGSPQLVFLRSLFMVTVVMAWAWKRGEPFWVTRGRAGALYWVRGILGTIGFVLLFGALRRIPLADTVILFQTHPFVVALLSPFLLGERLVARQWVFIGTSIAGVALVVGPSGEGSWTGRLMALGCALTTGVAMSLVRYLGRSVPALTISLAFPVVACLSMGPLLAAGVPGFVWASPTRADWWFIGLLALFGTVGQVLVTAGLRRVPAARGTAISNLQVVFAMALGVAVLGEQPAWTTIAGASIIVASLVLMSRVSAER